MRVQVVTLPDFNARDDTAIRSAVSQSNVVINLIGTERETLRFRFEEVHVDIAERIAQVLQGGSCVLHCRPIAQEAAHNDKCD